MPDLSDSRTQFTTKILTHLSNTDEQDTLEFTNLKDHVHISMDVRSFVQEFTVKVFEKIDGSIYQQISSKIFPADYEIGTETITIVLDGSGQDMKFTLQSSIAEGLQRDPPVNILETTRQ